MSCSQASSHPKTPVRRIPRGTRTQPVRHFVLNLTDEQHRLLRRSSQGMRGFSHPFVRYPDEGETIIQGRNSKRILADLAALFPNIEVEIRVPDAGDYIFDH